MPGDSLQAAVLPPLISLLLASCSVLISGAATGGCASALFLARAGAQVILVDRVPEPRAIGAGIAIAENGLAVLESLGLAGALAVAKPVYGARIVDANGRTLLAPRGNPPRAVMIRRSTLQRVLLDAVVSDPRIECRFGTEVVGASRNGEVTLRNESGQRTVKADLVVGADGVHSRIRDSGTFGAHVRTSGIRYVRTLLETDVATGTEAWTSAGLFGSFNVDGGTYAFASCGTRSLGVALDNRDLAAFRAVWARAYAPSVPILAGLTSFDELLQNEVIRVDCTRWHDGRLVLVGDAAHAMAPNLGQGANSALVDAAVLADELRRSESLEQALTAYHRRRAKAVRRVADASARLGALAEVTHVVPRTMRDRLLLPVAALLATEKATALLWQEPLDVLRTMGAR